MLLDEPFAASTSARETDDPMFEQFPRWKGRTLLISP